MTGLAQVASYRTYLGPSLVEIPATGSYDESSIEVNRPPMADLTVQSLDPTLGVGGAMRPGTEILVRRNGAKAFPGVIIGPKGAWGLDQTKTVRLIHKGYNRLRAKRCDPYVHNGPLVKSNSTYVAPWKYDIFRAPAGVLDGDGLTQALHGIPLDSVARCLFGGRFAFQIDFQDNRYIRVPTATVASGLVGDGTVQVYQADSEARPALQRTQRKQADYAAGQLVESIPLMSGDPNLDAMGVISGVESFILIGTKYSTQAPTVRVARNAGEGARTWTSVSLTETANYLGSGLTAWTFTAFTFADAPTQRTQLGIEITIPGSAADTDTTRLYYAGVIASTAEDTGLTAGTVTAYTAPSGLSVDTWAAFDLTGMNRMEAAERLRQSTLSVEATNPSPHWDIYVDAALAYHFVHRRGTTVTGVTFSTAIDGNLSVVERELYAEELAFQVIGTGMGRGSAQIVIVDKDPANGLYDATRDPASGNLYGEAAVVLEHKVSGTTSPTDVRRASQAYFRLVKDPQEYVRGTFLPRIVPEFTTGDSVTFRESSLGLNAGVRVAHIRRSWSGSDEGLEVEIGERLTTPRQVVQGVIQSQKSDANRPAGAVQHAGLSGPATVFDKNHYGRITFNVPDQVERVYVDLQTVPFQSTSKSASTVGGTGVPTSGSTSIPWDINKFAGERFPATTGVSESATTDFFTCTVPSSASTLYTLYQMWRNASGSSRSFTIQARKNSSSGDILATFTASSLANGAYQTQLAQLTQGSGTGQVTGGDVIHFVVSSGSIYFQDELILEVAGAQTHNHTVDISGHTHSLAFGIYQFDGDGGTGTGTPRYGEAIEWAVDPAVSSAGIPTAWSTDRHSLKFGTRAAPVRVAGLDITDQLQQDSSGRPRKGLHTLYFLGVAYTSGTAPLNTDGLSAVQAVVDFKFREVSA